MSFERHFSDFYYLPSFGFLQGGRWTPNSLFGKSRGRGRSSTLRLVSTVLYQLYTLHNASIRNLYSEVEGHIFGNLYFCKNLNDRETDDLLTLIPILNRYSIVARPDKRKWILKGPGDFSYHPSNLSTFPLAEFIWKSKIPSKMRAYIWAVVSNRANTNDLLQIKRPHKVLSPNVCYLF